MLNDLPDRGDLGRFLAAGLAALVVSVLVMTAVMVAGRRSTLATAVRVAAGTSLLVHAAFLLAALPPITG